MAEFATLAQWTAKVRAELVVPTPEWFRCADLSTEYGEIELIDSQIIEEIKKRPPWWTHMSQNQ